MHQLWEKYMTKAAKLVLDGDIRATILSKEEMVHSWAPILTTPSKEVEPELRSSLLLSYVERFEILRCL